jgi:hypothetical protein
MKAVYTRPSSLQPHDEFLGPTLYDHTRQSLEAKALAGVRDFADILAAGGPMVEPLRDPAFFARVFVELGAPYWPNGDIDAIALHQEMEAGGLLSETAAA